MQLTPRQIRARIAAAAQKAGSSKAVATAAGVSETRISKCLKSGANVPSSLLSVCGMWRDEQGDVRLVGDPGPARVQILVVQARMVDAVVTSVTPDGFEARWDGGPDTIEQAIALAAPGPGRPPTAEPPS